MLFHTACALALAAIMSTAPAVLAEEAQSHNSIPLRTHSLNAPFLDSDLQSRWWDYGGDTVIRADRYVRLASDLPSQAGYIWSRVPLTATNWEVEIEFSIHGKNNLFGDGMGIFFTSERQKQGTVFGNQDNFNGLAVFVDTYKNNRPGVIFPYVMAMMGDGHAAYDKHNDGKANELAGCSARGLRNTDFPTKIKLTYFAEKSLKVDLMYKTEGEWTDCFEARDVKLPSVTYVGLTAETGELSDNFDIFNLDTRNLYSASTSPQAEALKKPIKTSSHHSSSGRNGGSWMWTLLKLVVLGLLIAGAYVAYTMYRTHKRDRF